MMLSLYRALLQETNDRRKRLAGATFSITRTSALAKHYRGMCRLCGQTVAAGTDRPRVKQVTRGHVEGCFGHIVHFKDEESVVITRPDCAPDTILSSDEYVTNRLDHVTCIRCSGTEKFRMSLNHGDKYADIRSPR